MLHHLECTARFKFYSHTNACKLSYWSPSDVLYDDTKIMGADDIAIHRSSIVALTYSLCVCKSSRCHLMHAHRRTHLVQKVLEVKLSLAAQISDVLKPCCTICVYQPQNVLLQDHSTHSPIAVFPHRVFNLCRLCQHEQQYHMAILGSAAMLERRICRTIAMLLCSAVLKRCAD